MSDGENLLLGINFTSHLFPATSKLWIQDENHPVAKVSPFNVPKYCIWLLTSTNLHHKNNHHERARWLHTPYSSKDVEVGRGEIELDSVVL